MKNIVKIILLTSVASCAMPFSGCTSQSVTPLAEEFGPIMRANRSIPVIVGLKTNTPDGIKFIQSGLKESLLFNEVIYPINSENELGYVLNLNFNCKKDNSAYEGLKIGLAAAFLLPTVGLSSGLLEMNDNYNLSCTAVLIKNGVKLKTYSAKGEAVYIQGGWSSGNLYPKVQASIWKQVQVDLVNQLLNDRAFLERQLTPSE